MTIYERITAFDYLFYNLQNTNSRIEKEQLIKQFLKDSPDLHDDWKFILETLSGEHPIGFTFTPPPSNPYAGDLNQSISSVIEYLTHLPDTTNDTITKAERFIGRELGEFIAPIVNRTLRLGIGKSLLSTKIYTPMLAKKFEPFKHRLSVLQSFFITEKLDGNRCIASYDHNLGTWRFTSRTGKPLKVWFNMSNFPKDIVFDGEILSQEQTALSYKRTYYLMSNISDISLQPDSSLLFNKTTGAISSGTSDKSSLVYNIFDIVDSSKSYEQRRKILSQFMPNNDKIRILPVLAETKSKEEVSSILGKMTQMGAEGIMLNISDAPYEQKRSSSLLKCKNVQTMDMLVVDIFEGKGKYENQCGGLICKLITASGDVISCEVGTGLSDADREEFWSNPDLVIGKVVEIGYHEKCQSASTLGTKQYSLRFPRFIKIRSDKKDGSEW